MNLEGEELRCLPWGRARAWWGFALAHGGSPASVTCGKTLVTDHRVTDSQTGKGGRVEYEGNGSSELARKGI